MKQITFADAEYSNKRKQTRKELFLKEMEQVVPWKGLIGMIEPAWRRRPPQLSPDGYAASAFVAKLVWLQ